MNKNVEKNKVVKKILADFLEQLQVKRNIALRMKKRLAKHNIINRSSLFFFTLDFGIDVIKNIQFESVDNIDCVKNLKLAESIFPKKRLLKNFKFPDYQSHIDPLFLRYIDIEIQLDKLNRTALDLLKRDRKLAGEDARLLVMNLRNLNDRYFNKKEIDYDEYKTTALKLIDHAQSLSKHLAYENILKNLVFLILTLGIAFIYNQAVNGHFFFFQKNEVTEQLDTINQFISTANPSSA